MSSANFAQSYADARGKFLAAAETAGLDVHSHLHPMLGRDGEPLALDVVRDGPADAQAVLLLSSACHGVEGFCGSGIQISLLGDAALRDAAHGAGVALLYLHGLNPYGFSWWRRTTQENVDLNRNFQDFSQPLPQNAGYDDIAHLLVPEAWPPSDVVRQGLADYLQQHGLPAFQRAVSGGQYRHPQGLFFGGHNPSWSQQALRQVLRDHGQHCAQLGWIDFHTGLGPSGFGERIFAGRDEAAAVARARAWWGGVDGQAITSIYDGSSSSAALTGLMCTVAYDECPQAKVTGIALEYGTLPFEQVLDALRADQWAENHPEAPAVQQRTIKQQLRDAFYTDTEAWKQQVLAQGVEAAHQAVTGLGAAA